MYDVGEELTASGRFIQFVPEHDYRLFLQRTRRQWLYRSWFLMRSAHRPWPSFGTFTRRT